MGGTHNFDVTRLLVLAVIVVVLALALSLLRGAEGTSLWVFAWACLLSPMVSPLEWPHYGVMLAPMILVLAAYAWGHPRVELWLGLFVGYALSNVVWNPAQSSVALFTGNAETLDDVYRTFVVASMAQVVFVALALVVTGPAVAAERAVVDDQIESEWQLPLALPVADSASREHERAAVGHERLPGHVARRVRQEE